MSSANFENHHPVKYLPLADDFKTRVALYFFFLLYIIISISLLTFPKVLKLLNGVGKIYSLRSLFFSTMMTS
ncbi:MAG: hypothetical protein A3H57_04170 [Candidatus Taylorbacteria bacterium RIFCSPLOWO2_02_FULL_43_11]|uniref:Uncharacterized protein n=1 Tax=Candidatus Taylorbacteria bacterium RIFCSPHIGHO2_02_FULL_43_32b TaxID=1802306 RepID=A0A1G2MHJ1_9BACT|nr:MAG: hypothetical protein A2743_04155 [Candidatus Taylorbacteria bacterium RIFCSPHIGHO2_01_FULL_43_47]OHA23303.1 MAG: hypothetical protein A3C72_04575 [Candidatus Taylorbacteria bacterium RIFCSPHIGHO2_02_FULL_43_32b]OHA30171.1 MAG: hypothetical protein A3B08_03705 [Candidatus Taylorbacteria bacterium RIFCSPLOWO2_01_FULL_43_44]OHA36020.1 MAG: hypothetical protein A3H57_04170 [Candidatus Taylorbacteria bacterium RIFCSPLOWO2_02_FULL_43_11]